MLRFLRLSINSSRYRLLWTACVASLVASAAQASADTSGDTSQITTKQYELGLAILKRSSLEPNLTLSPFSIHAALTLGRLGAVGPTAAELDNVLFSESLSEKTLAAYASLNSIVAPPDAQAPAKLANSIWVDSRAHFLPKFLRDTTGAFQAEARSIDFRLSDRARETINDWVSSKTNSMIPNLLPPGMPRSDTSAALVNALYFKAPWDTPFAKSSTRDDNFWVAEGVDISIPMMRLKASLPYYEDDTWQGVTLTYIQGAYSHVFLVPRNKLSTKSVASGLSFKLLADTLNSKKRFKVSLSLPRHTIRHNKQLVDDIRALGAPLALSSNADYSAMTSVPVTVGGIVHESVVSVDEVGTEAAAATAIVMTKSALLLAEENRTVVADHPFAFALVHTATQAPLFIGVVGKP